MVPDPWAEPRDQRLREAVAWPLAQLCWLLRLGRLGDHFEDVAWCGTPWFRAAESADESASSGDEP